MKKQWTAEEDRRLEASYRESTLEQLSKEFGTNVYQIRKRAAELGLGAKKAQIKWTKWQDRFLKERHGELTVRELAPILHHTPSAVRQRLYRMGLPKKNQRKQWTTKEVKRLREMYFEKHIPIKEIAKALDIDYKKVYMKIYALEGEKQDEKINQKTAGRDVYREHR